VGLQVSGLRIVHTILSKGFAGSERATAEMCNAHCREHTVLLVLKRGHTRNGVSIRQWLDPAVQVIEVGNWLPRAGMARALAEFRPDVIHAHLRRSTRLLARIRPPAATIATLHLTANGPHFADMDGLICIAEWQHEDIPRGYRGRVFDINESLIPNRRLSATEIAALRRELGAAPDEYLVGGVGRLARSKGFDVLIEAFKRARLPAARLVIVGEGRERSRLERGLVANISLPGFRADAKDCYQAFDLFVSPSRSEPLGRVVLEALDAGVPVVASTTRGPTEILSRYPGELFPIEDVEALAALLRQCYEQRPQRTQHDLSAYHLPTIARETEAAYRELIDAKRVQLRASAN
jgi:glycosyltransferase involved in cell wall biosynthesis